MYRALVIAALVAAPFGGAALAQTVGLPSCATDPPREEFQQGIPLPLEETETYYYMSDDGEDDPKNGFWREHPDSQVNGVDGLQTEDCFSIQKAEDGREIKIYHYRADEKRGDLLL